MRKITGHVLIGLLPFLLAAELGAQKTETVDGVRVVHNEKGGRWGKNPHISLELARKIGDIETEDEHFAFSYPSDVVMDKEVFLAQDIKTGMDSGAVSYVQ